MVEERKEDILSLFKEWRDRLTEEEKIILLDYSKYLYEEINNFLKEGVLDSDMFGTSPDDLRLREYTEKIDKILARFILNKAIPVYRVEHYDIKIDDLYEFLIGIREINYKSFVSTAFTEAASNNYLSNLKKHYPKDTFLNLKGVVKEGVTCGYLDKELSAMLDSEDEILISRNIYFRINSEKINKNNDKNEIYVLGEFRKESFNEKI